MKAIAGFWALLFVAACADQPRSSLGDSPVKDVRCPSFLDHKSCMARAERECGGRITVLSAPGEEEMIGLGSTVPIDGRIVYRTMRVRCEE